MARIQVPLPVPHGALAQKETVDRQILLECCAVSAQPQARQRIEPQMHLRLEPASQ